MKKLSFVVLLIFSLILSGCAKTPSTNPSYNPQDPDNELANSITEFYVAIDENDVSEARELYEEVIAEENESAEAVYSELLTRLETALSDYNSGAITDSDATVTFNTIGALGILEDSDYSPLQNSLNNLISSKTAFATAENFYASGNYYDAYVYYMDVIPEDQNYSTAVTNSADALNLLVTDLINEAETCRTELNYTDAILSLRDSLVLLGNNEQLQTELNLLESEYLQFALDSAEATHQDNNNYQGAINIINSAMNILDNSELTEAKNYYESFTPVALLEEEAWLRDSPSGLENCLQEWDWEPDDTDNYGNTYTYGNRYIANSSGDDLAITYLLDGQYNRLTGAWVVHYNSRNAVDDDGTIDTCHSIISIYGDDQLLYTSPVMGYTVEPAFFDIDITNVNELRIEIDFTSRANAIWYDGQCTDSISAGLVDVYVSRTI